MVKRTRTAGTAAALVGGALLLAGCGGQAATNSAVGMADQAADQGANAAGSAAKPEQGDISASNCSSEDFEITLQAQPSGGTFLLQMTNLSDEACDLGGWVNLTPTNMAGEKFEIPTDYVNEPGPDQDLTLAPGTSAFAGVKYETGQQSDPNDQVASGFAATPSDMSGEITAQVKDTNGGDTPIDFPIKSLQVGTLQESAQGVVAF